MPDSPEPKDFDVLSDPEQIASLAHADRLAILGELVDGARTGSQVAERLGLPVQRTHYHLGRLVKDGLVVEVGLVDKRFKQERFYRAVARHHLVYPAHGGTNEATGRAVVEAFERVFEVWRRRELLDIDLGHLAERIVVDALRTQPGDRILVVGPPQVREIQEAIFLEVEMQGGRPALRPWSRDYIFSRVARMRDAATIGLPFIPDADTDELAGVVLVTSTQPAGAAPNQRQRENLPHLLQSLTKWQRTLRERGVRQVELSVPVRGDVADGDAGVDEAIATFWRALATTADELERRADTLLAQIGTADTLELRDTGGRRLALEFDRTRPHRNVGRFPSESLANGHVYEEFPPGSISLLAIPGTAVGQLRFPYVSVAGVRIRDVTLTVNEGRITKVDAPEQAEILRERLASAVGDANSVAEVRIGLNPAGRTLTGKASLDAVLEGTVTLAFGSNETLGGTQSATLDLRFPARDIEVRAGGSVVVALDPSSALPSN